MLTHRLYKRENRHESLLLADDKLSVSLGWNSATTVVNFAKLKNLQEKNSDSLGINKQKLVRIILVHLPHEALVSTIYPFNGWREFG